MNWTDNDCLVLSDGTRFAIFSEQIRGERRFYRAEMQKPEDHDTVRWVSLTAMFDGSYDKRTVKRRVERYARSLETEHLSSETPSNTQPTRLADMNQRAGKDV